MKINHLDTIADAIATLAETDGLRAGCEALVGPVAVAISANLVFIARGREDSAIADVVAAHGLGAADFRRLESRLTKSSLWQIMRMSAPVAIDDLSRDAALSSLAFSTGTRFVIAVPIMLGDNTEGLVAAGFSPRERPDEDEIIRLLKVIASVIAQTIKVEVILSDESRRLAEENVNLKQELKQRHDFGNLIGNSGPMRQVFDQAAQVARSASAVLIRGENGTGKEILASAIHYNSLRSKRPFIKVNCSAMDEAVADRDVFGDGATKKGLFEQAGGGTVFFDEIGDLPGSAQLKLLDLLTGRRSEATARVIAATGRGLDDAVDDGEFRQDLLHLLNTFTISLPPLRERRSDILLLAEHFLDKYKREQKKDIRRLSTPAIDMLAAYHFPGNVRELENVIERAVAACDANVIHSHHLPPTLQTAELSDTLPRLTLTAAVEAFESDMIQDALKSTSGNIARAAKMLDSTERILGYKIKKYDINPRRFRRWEDDRKF